MSEILGKEKAIRLLQDVLSFATADQTEVSLQAGTTSLTRFANNYIHQNVQETNTVIRVRSIFGQKIGTATGNSANPADLKALVARAEQLARFQVDDPGFITLPGPDMALDDRPVPEPDEETFSATPETRARAVGIICSQSTAQNLTASGSFQTQGNEIAIANSLGLTNYHRGASAEISTVIMGDTSSGYAQRLATRVADINGEEVAAEAIDKVLRSANPQPLEPGEYEVILEEYAVAEMLNYMSYLGFGAMSVQEGRSFMQFERKLMNEQVSIYDDGHDSRMVASPFDAEGVTRQRVALIEKGVAKNVVYDTYTAQRETGRTTTGHSTGMRGDIGPLPLHIFIEPGSSSKAEMLKDIKKGLWVTRFHYVNPLVPDKAVLTGMTRDGTFLIENGEITRPVRNFRFTQSAVEAFRDVVSLSADRKLLPSFGGSNLVPALRVARFQFNSATEF